MHPLHPYGMHGMHGMHGTPLGLHCKAMHGLGGLPPPFCIACCIALRCTGGAPHAMQPPVRPVRPAPVRPVRPREAYGMQGLALRGKVGVGGVATLGRAGFEPALTFISGFTIRPHKPLGHRPNNRTAKTFPNCHQITAFLHQKDIEQANEEKRIIVNCVKSNRFASKC
jgi:hypothetical protein